MARAMASRIMPKASASNIALGGLERNRGRHGPRHVVDIAADDHHSADLGDGPAEACKDRGNQAIAAVPQQSRHDGRRRRPERAKLLAIFLEQILAGLARQRRDDGGHQNDLRNDHGLRRVEELEHPNGPALERNR